MSEVTQTSTEEIVVEIDKPSDGNFRGRTLPDIVGPENGSKYLAAVSCLLAKHKAEQKAKNEKLEELFRSVSRGADNLLKNANKQEALANFNDRLEKFKQAADEVV